MAGIKEELLPHGESLRRALRWLGTRRQEDPKRPANQLIDEAALRFDLSPAEAEFLHQNWRAE
jgi:hypothetical protein